MFRTTTSCFFSGSLSLSCCQLIAFLRPFGPPQSCHVGPPGASVTVCHIEGLEVCGFCPVPRVFFLLGRLLQLLDLKMKFVVFRVFQTELSWTVFWPWDLLHVFFISLKRLCDSHSLQLIVFTFFFLSREFSVEILHLPFCHFELCFSFTSLSSWQSSWALVMVVFQVLELSAFLHSSRPQY